MHILKITIHNFRSFKNEEFLLDKYSLLIGENNVGKTNVVSALRIFYEEIKFDAKSDFPKFDTDDSESWIEIDFKTTEDEQLNLKDEYKNSNSILKVRKYLKSDDVNLVKPAQSNIYAYENEVLSQNLFYGAKNISSAKLGNIIYIPESSKTDDGFKMSGPSPLREMVSFVMNRAVKTSPSFSTLQTSFDKFNKAFRSESSKDGFSINDLVKDINQNLSQWEINFGLEINPISTSDIVKNLVSHWIEDNQLNGAKININLFGQGLQRHLIYTLIRLGSRYIEKKSETKKEFSPDFTLILFDEPEAFLHPAQQELLNMSLNELSLDYAQQILITTHSPIFVSKNIDNLPSLIRILREKGSSNAHQISSADLNAIFDANSGLYKKFHGLLLDSNTPDALKNKIKKRNFASDTEDDAQKIEEESLRYALWLDYDRASSFFAKHVIICEGSSEKVFLDHLLNSQWTELKNKNIYCLDALGKFNIHRYMNLFDKLGISHSILFDKDDDQIHEIVNDFLSANKNSHTRAFHSFDKNLETFLNIPISNRSDKKPLNVMWHYIKGKIATEKVDELKSVFIKLIDY